MFWLNFFFDRDNLDADFENSRYFFLSGHDRSKISHRYHLELTLSWPDSLNFRALRDTPKKETLLQGQEYQIVRATKVIYIIYTIRKSSINVLLIRNTNLCSLTVAECQSWYLFSRQYHAWEKKHREFSKSASKLSRSKKNFNQNKGLS